MTVGFSSGQAPVVSAQTLLQLGVTVSGNHYGFWLWADNLFSFHFRRIVRWGRQTQASAISRYNRTTRWVLGRAVYHAIGFENVHFATGEC